MPASARVIVESADGETDTTVGAVRSTTNDHSVDIAGEPKTSLAVTRTACVPSDIGPA